MSPTLATITQLATLTLALIGAIASVWNVATSQRTQLRIARTAYNAATITKLRLQRIARIRKDVVELVTIYDTVVTHHRAVAEKDSDPTSSRKLGLETIRELQRRSRRLVSRLQATLTPAEQLEANILRLTDILGDLAPGAEPDRMRYPAIRGALLSSVGARYQAEMDAVRDPEQAHDFGITSDAQARVAARLTETALKGGTLPPKTDR